MQGNSPTLRRPFADRSLTFRRPFANLFCQPLCSLLTFPCFEALVQKPRLMTSWQLFRNQEKGVLAKGVSVESSVTAKAAKNIQGYWPQQFIWGLKSAHSQERRTFCRSPLLKTSFSQEWPRQTKPKKGQFMNFSQGHSGTKVQCESCLFS